MNSSVYFEAYRANGGKPLAVIVTDGMADCLPNVQTFVEESTALGLALRLSVLAEEFRKEEGGLVSFRPIPYQALTQCERLGTAAAINQVLIASRRADRVLHVIGLTDEEADLWRKE